MNIENTLVVAMLLSFLIFYYDILENKFRPKFFSSLVYLQENFLFMWIHLPFLLNLYSHCRTNIMV